MQSIISMCNWIHKLFFILSIVPILQNLACILHQQRLMAPVLDSTRSRENSWRTRRQFVPKFLVELPFSESELPYYNPPWTIWVPGILKSRKEEKVAQVHFCHSKYGNKGCTVRNWAKLTPSWESDPSDFFFTNFPWGELAHQTDRTPAFSSAAFYPSPSQWSLSLCWSQLPSYSHLPSPDQTGRHQGCAPSPELLPTFLCASLRDPPFKLPPNSQGASHSFLQRTWQSQGSIDPLHSIYFQKYNSNTVKILVSQRGFPITHTSPSGSHFIIIL